MGLSFEDSRRYASAHSQPNGPGDGRPTARQIIDDNDLVGKMTDKVMLVTGGSSGLGIDIVRQLARTGATIYFTSRDIEKGEKVRRQLLEEGKDAGDELKIEMIHMDLVRLESVREGAEDFKRKSEKLHVLCNNAGIGLVPKGSTQDGFESHFGVNHVAHFYLFELLKPLMLASSTAEFNSRVVSVSSSIHTFSPCLVGDYNLENVEGGYNVFIAYGNSKTANIWFANELDRRYGDRGLHALSVHPGGITETGFSRHHDPAIMDLLNQILEQEHIKKALKSTGQGAASVVLAAIGKDYEGAGGFYMEDCGKSPLMAEDAPMGAPGYKPWAYDEEKERRLWEDSLRMVGLAGN